MAGHSTRRQRRHKGQASVPATGDWSNKIELTGLGQSGLLSRLVLRRLGGLAPSTVDVMIFYGAGSTYDSVTDFSLVPDEDRAYDETGIAVPAASPTAAAADRNLLSLYGGIVYDVRSPGDRVWVAVKDAGGVALDMVVSVEARDTL